MNKFKFRVWDEDEKRFWFFDLQELLERRMSYRGSFDEKIMIGIKEQSTGLHDKNGAGIYVGDIVKGSIQCGANNAYGVGEVHWSDDYCGWLITITNDDCAMYEVSMNDIGELEVIGNIHEKKEV